MTAVGWYVVLVRSGLRYISNCASVLLYAAPLFFLGGGSVGFSVYSSIGGAVRAECSGLGWAMMLPSRVGTGQLANTYGWFRRRSLLIVGVMNSFRLLILLRCCP